MKWTSTKAKLPESEQRLGTDAPSQLNNKGRMSEMSKVLNLKTSKTNEKKPKSK